MTSKHKSSSAVIGESCHFRPGTQQRLTACHSDFVIGQLLKLAHKLYLGDEAQRKMFSGLLCDLLIAPETPSSLVEEFMRLLNTIHNPDESIALAIENISRMQEPLAAMKEKMGDELQKIETVCLHSLPALLSVALPTAATVGPVHVEPE